MRRGSWFNTFAADSKTRGLQAETREELAKLDGELYRIWNLGDNVLLAWTYDANSVLVLSVRHYAIAEAVHAVDSDESRRDDMRRSIHEVLAGPKYLPPDEFRRVCIAFKREPEKVQVAFHAEYQTVAAVVSEIVRCYGVSLVRERAVVLLDIVGFSLRAPLDQMAMLNSLAYSINSAYGQLLSKNINVNFARTTTGDGYYIWNRSTASGANTELFKLLMMILADNAVAQRKARSSWVPKLRAGFHVGEHYEFQQVEGLNPTTFGYIVGQVTVDLARMVDRALPGQILMGDFAFRSADSALGFGMHIDTPDFVEGTAITLDQLNGLNISDGQVASIRCYLTGQSLGGGRYMVSRFHIRDKHGGLRHVYNAKMNIHRSDSAPLYLGMRAEDLADFECIKIESLSRDAEDTGSFIVRP